MGELVNDPDGQAGRREQNVSNSALYALVLFAVAGTVAQWVSIWHVLNRLNKLERGKRS